MMNDESFLLRPAVPADASALTAIAHAAKRHWGYPEAWIEHWKPALTITPAYLQAHPAFVAEQGGRIVGFGAIVLAGASAQLDHLWVLPDAMGQGIGRALLIHAEQLARAAGASRLWTEADPHAEAFYRHLGLTKFSETDAPMGGTPRVLPLLEKRL